MATTVRPDLLWIRQRVINTVGDDEVRVGNCIDVDSNNNVYGIYYTNGTASGGTFVGNYDLVFFKLDPAGNVVWIRQNNGTSSPGIDYLTSITVDSSGAPIGAAIIDGTLSGQAGSGGNDVGLLKLDTNGNTQWIRQSSAFNTSAQDYYPAVGTDSANNVYFIHQSQVSNFQVRISKFTSAGTRLWTVTDTAQVNDVNANSDQPTIAVAPNGNIYAAFHTGGTIPGQTRAGLGLDSGTSKIVVFKMNTSGAVQWVKQASSFNASGNNALVRIAIDANENVYGAYHTSGAISGSTNRGSNDIVVFKLDSNGNTLWARQPAATLINTTGSEDNAGIAVTSAGYIYLGYHTTGTVSGGSRRGAEDIVLVGMDTNGNVEFTRQTNLINTTAADTNVTVACNDSNDVWLSYTTSGTVSGGLRAGLKDVVVAKFNIFRAFPERRFRALPVNTMTITGCRTGQITAINC